MMLGGTIAMTSLLGSHSPTKPSELCTTRRMASQSALPGAIHCLSGHGARSTDATLPMSCRTPATRRCKVGATMTTTGIVVRNSSKQASRINSTGMRHCGRAARCTRTPRSPIDMRPALHLCAKDGQKILTTTTASDETRHRSASI